MLEWYEAYADYNDTMERIEQLVARTAQEVLGTTKVTFRGQEIDFAPPWRRVKFVDALAEHGLWTRDERELRKLLQARDVDVSHDPTWSKLIDHAHSHFVEPALVQPTILHDYPIELSPFARLTDDDPTHRRALRVLRGGMELGNAFSEINDAEEQAQRFALQQNERDAGDVEAEEGDPDYVDALSYGMPPTGGIGLGIDRLAMLFTGTRVDPRTRFSSRRCVASTERGAKAVHLAPDSAQRCRHRFWALGERLVDDRRRPDVRDHVGEDLVERPRRLPADRAGHLLDRRLAVEHVLDALPVDLVVRDVDDVGVGAGRGEHAVEQARRSSRARSSRR